MTADHVVKASVWRLPTGRWVGMCQCLACPDQWAGVYGTMRSAQRAAACHIDTVHRDGTDPPQPDPQPATRGASTPHGADAPQSFHGRERVNGMVVIIDAPPAQDTCRHRHTIEYRINGFATPIARACTRCDHIDGLTPTTHGGHQ